MRRISQDSQAGELRSDLLEQLHAFCREIDWIGEPSASVDAL